MAVYVSAKCDIFTKRQNFDISNNHHRKLALITQFTCFLIFKLYIDTLMLITNT